jgi:hypothetical protein
MSNACEMHENFKHISMERLNEMVTTAYKSQLALKRLKKKTREINIPMDHWYRIMPYDKRIEMVQRVAENIETIINDQILQSPSSALNDYYRTLQHRVMHTKISLPALCPKDIAKLPTYDASIDKLYGTPIQFLKLISVAYPSSVRRQKFIRTY